MTGKIVRSAALPLLFVLFFLITIAATPTGRKDGPGQDRPRSDVRGKITLSRKEAHRMDAPTDPLMERYMVGGDPALAAAAAAAMATPPKLSERVAVYLVSDDLDAQPYPAPSKNPMLDQKNLQFHPQVLPVLVGTSVDFPNRDRLYHNVFSYSQSKEFDLGRYPRDDSRTVKFDRPGIVRVYCDIHTHMNATILVLQNPYFATPDDSGNFVIRGVPEGSYTIVLWYERDIAERRTVEVKSGEAAEVNFTL